MNFTEFIELLKLLGGVASALLAVVALVSMVIKPIRKKLISWIRGTSNADSTSSKLDSIEALLEKHINEDRVKQASQEIQKEALKCLLRSEILRIYYKNLFSCEIREFEFQNVCYLYNAYVALGGNSFIKKIYEEIHEWKVVS